jgi:hypothetical protein
VLHGVRLAEEGPLIHVLHSGTTFKSNKTVGKIIILKHRNTTGMIL